MTLLNPISIDEAALRRRLDQVAEYEDFDEFDPSIGWTFDSTLSTITDVIADVMQTGNAALAGNREYPNGHVATPNERLDLCLLADPDGSIAGYIWTYDLSGGRSLSIATGFLEWKDFSSCDKGIDGIVQIVWIILSCANRAINDYNAFVTGGAA